MRVEPSNSVTAQKHHSVNLSLVYQNYRKSGKTLHAYFTEIIANSFFQMYKIKQIILLLQVNIIKC